MNGSNNDVPDRLARLTGYLASDPNNLSLLLDASEAALSERRPGLAVELMERYGALAALEGRALNVASLAALQTGAHAKAADGFAILLETEPHSPALRFNRAWALAMDRHFEEALTLLDEDSARSLAQAAMLRVQIMHQLGHVDEAAEAARAYILVHPEHEGLMAATSVLAIDIEDLELADNCAKKAGGHPDALTTLGILALGRAADSEAADMFERALAIQGQSPRAWVGKGLAELIAGTHAEAAKHIERGAEMFGDHIGSWIAAGWAHLLSNDINNARRAFERALLIDDNFAESHGSLAVIAALEGRSSEAERLVEVALRLDKQSFAAVFARTLLLQAQGKAELARAIFERALNTPIDASGATIAQALAKRALFP